MLLCSTSFWLIFPFIFFIYWGIPAKHSKLRMIFILMLSYLLYMNWNPAFAFVLLGITCVTYIGGLALRDSGGSRRKIVAIFSFLGILPLFTFKYYNFINTNVNHLLDWANLRFTLPGLNWAIPIGISFFTFQAIGYLLDVYFKRIEAEENFLDYMLFISFFPHLSAGPISKASELLPQIKTPHIFSYDQFRQGMKYVLWGLFLKLVLADRLGLFVNTTYNNFESATGINCLIASIFFSLQIYTDFAGYSYLAMGISKALGFNIINNFRRPYFAISITDFWKRWHISLSRWLKDYIYIPMGGSRCSKSRNYWNIFITFLVSGAWHGANWTYIAWGCFHGISQIVEKQLGLQKCLNKGRLVKGFRIILTFITVNVSWIFFRMPTFGQAIRFIRKILTDPGRLDIMAIGPSNHAIIFAALGILAIKDFKDELNMRQINVFFNKPFIRWSVYIILIVSIISCGNIDSSQFIYLNF